jgi:hypothetical protein
MAQPPPRSLDGVPTIIDWKTTGRPRTSLADGFGEPLQVVAYHTALLADPFYAGQLPAPLRDTLRCALVYAYDDGSPGGLPPPAAGRVPPRLNGGREQLPRLSWSAPRWSTRGRASSAGAGRDSTFFPC